ncbi:MAG: 50S ribosomal protein L10 [Oscillospiraceae bacterium]|nr:50S ribosomal protein L10 [Oscillospiraceae bacterium]
MPSEKILSEKQALVAELHDKIANSVAGVVVDYKGISVADDTKLRTELREAGVEYMVVKNTMLKLALKDTAFEGMSSVLEGTTAFAISNEDPIAAARVLNKFAEASKTGFAIKAGYMDGEVMDADAVKAIANLPSKEVLLSMLCSALQGNIRGLAVALNAIAEKNGEGEVA